MVRPPKGTGEQIGSNLCVGTIDSFSPSLGSLDIYRDGAGR
jgi:hypothetical protein